ncbi:hypothetical protein [Gemmatimonas sp.]|uniref:hypothetical protein n=1 Tax=Gemmatimonas sp. TaxID=1962908 RepID=UPI00333E7C9F
MLREALGILHSDIDLQEKTLAIHTIDAAGTVVRTADVTTNRAAVTAYFSTLDGPHQVLCAFTGK